MGLDPPPELSLLHAVNNPAQQPIKIINKNIFFIIAPKLFNILEWLKGYRDAAFQNLRTG